MGKGKLQKLGKGKLQKFADMATYPHVFEHPYAGPEGVPFAMKGQWDTLFFRNGRPLTLELGCGRGEYTVGLARRMPERNFIGIDIKGARMWTGATDALRTGLKNVAFLRTRIEAIDQCFAPGEVDELWLTFSDPQMKKRFLRDGGRIHVKTDSPFLYTYTRLMAEHNALPVLAMTDDLYASPLSGGVLTDIRTYYEQQWLDRGMTIKYICFCLPQEGELAEPEVDIPLDDYRSYGRSKRSGLEVSR